MRSFRPADSHALINLLRNGGFDVYDVANQTAHFWSILGAVHKSVSEGSNSDFEIIRNSQVGGPCDFLLARILSAEPFLLRQNFISDTPLDFPVPIAPNSNRSEVPAGFLNVYERLPIRTRALSFGLSVRVIRGIAKITARFLDSTGAICAEVILAARINSAFTRGRWQRLSGSATPSASAVSVIFMIERTSDSDLCEISLANIQLSLGAYRVVPYTGDLFVSTMPPNAVVLSLGDTCPPGFVELEEPDGTVPEAWLAANPEAKIVSGNFPYHASSGMTDGEPTHGLPEVQFEESVTEIVAFESFSSLLAASVTGQNGYNPNIRSPADEPTEDNTTDHQHSLEDAGSIPVNRQFTFCRKL